MRRPNQYASSYRPSQRIDSYRPGQGRATEWYDPLDWNTDLPLSRSWGDDDLLQAEPQAAQETANIPAPAVRVTDPPTLAT